MTQKRATQTESRTKAKPAALKDDELEAVSGGPTEELFGNYHFLLEVAETGSNRTPVRTKRPLGTDDGS